jgi:hypothetical protein
MFKTQVDLIYTAVFRLFHKVCRQFTLIAQGGNTFMG